MALVRREWLEIVDRTRLILASGKPVLHKMARWCLSALLFAHQSWRQFQTNQANTIGARSHSSGRA